MYGTFRTGLYTDSKCSRHLSSDCDRVKPIYWKVTKSELTLRCFGGGPGEACWRVVVGGVTPAVRFFLTSSVCQVHRKRGLSARGYYGRNDELDLG